MSRLTDTKNASTTIEYWNGAGIDEKLRQKSDDGLHHKTYYFTQDQLNSTRALTDGNGNLIESTAYKPTRGRR